jgi:alanine dehydrogenase
LTEALKTCDVAIGALRGDARAPVVVTEEMVKKMKYGAVIVDVSIDNGGCFDTSEVTTHSKPTFVKHDVIHYCVPNIPSRYSRTASVSISNIFTPYLLNIGDKGGLEVAARFDQSLRKGMYFYHGILTNRSVSEWFNLPYTDINLLIL